MIQLRTASTSAAIRQISTSGLPARMVLPTVMDALRDVVAYDMINFLWLDRDCRSQEWHSIRSGFEDVYRVFCERYGGPSDCGAVSGHERLIRELGTDRSGAIPLFGETEFFNEVIRPLGQRHFLRMGISDAGGPIGAFLLLRQPGTRDFTRDDEAKLERLRHWLTAALAGRSTADDDMSLVDDSSELMIVNQRGDPLFLSAQARDLVCHASGLRMTPFVVSDRRHDWAKPIVPRLIAQLAARDGRPMGAHATATLRSDAGNFVLKAHWVEEANSGGNRAAAVQIRRQIPLRLRLMQSERLRSLSPREQQVCVLLARGLSYNEIAEAMGVTRSGAVYHIREAYGKLGISSQERLLPALFSPPSALAAAW